MAEASIPVDLFNPGQVFACLGFMEAADVLLGEAEGGFDWSNETRVRFRLHAGGEENPVAVVLAYLAEAQVRSSPPVGYAAPLAEKEGSTSPDEDENEDQIANIEFAAEHSETFPGREADRMALPVRLVVDLKPSFSLDHWADGSSRKSFKLYAGNRSAGRIVSAMLRGTRAKPTKLQAVGAIKTPGIASLWSEQREELTTRPFDVLTPMGGSFNFDPRGAWTGIDAGYSPNTQKHAIAASPVVEVLAALGLKDARPNEYETRAVRYGTWNRVLPLVLARPALAGVAVGVPAGSFREFRFTLDLSGKNKVVTFAEEEA